MPQNVEAFIKKFLDLERVTAII